MGYCSSLVGCHQKLALSMEIIGIWHCVHTWMTSKIILNFWFVFLQRQFGFGYWIGSMQEEINYKAKIIDWFYVIVLRNVPEKKAT